MKLGDYITAQNAQRICGIGRRTLHHHAQTGSVRAIEHKISSGPGRSALMYHIDDINKLTWPGTSELAKASGVPRHIVLGRLYRFDIRGVVFHAGRWRFPPHRFDHIVRWFRDGCPARPGFIPMEIRRH